MYQKDLHTLLQILNVFEKIYQDLITKHYLDEAEN